MPAPRATATREEAMGRKTKEMTRGFPPGRVILLQAFSKAALIRLLSTAI